MTPLMLAAQAGHTDAVNVLLEFGCDVNAQNYVSIFVAIFHLESVLWEIQDCSITC